MISEKTMQAVRDFVDERNWDQFHTPENLAKSISIEAGELLECYQWDATGEEADHEHVEEELADVLIYCIQLSQKLGLDCDRIIMSKLRKNAAKYPVKLAKDSKEKYTELRKQK